MRILIVEDEWLIAMHLEEVLREAGHDVVEIAATAEQAIALADQRCPDLIFMDVRLQGEVDGITAAEAIRRRADGLPIAFLTAQVDEATRQRCMAVDPVACISKPVDPELLVQFVRSLARGETDRSGGTG